MDENELLSRVSVDPLVCQGKPHIKGTRIMVDAILDNLAADIAELEILTAYPALAPEDIRAALVYAATMVRERFIPTRAAVSAPVEPSGRSTP